MKMITKEQKNFYSNVDWNLMYGYSVTHLPSDPEGAGWERLLMLCASFDLLAIEDLEREPKEKIRFRDIVRKFLMSWNFKDEFNGVYKK